MIVTRGCGRRQSGAVYLEVETSPMGMPIETFLLDPPVQISPDTFAALGLSNIGVKVIKKTTRTACDPDESARNISCNVWDIVGESHYPNTVDIIEEARRFGFSRRLPKTLDFSLLTPQSRLILLHQRAWIENFAEYAKRPAGFADCPKHITSHDPWWDGTTAINCIGMLWQDVEDGIPFTETEAGRAEIDNPAYHRLVIRNMPSFEYRAFRRPDGVTPDRSLAIFANLPIGRIVVVKDDEGGQHEAAFERARQSSLPVEIVNE